MHTKRLRLRLRKTSTFLTPDITALLNGRIDGYYDVPHEDEVWETLRDILFGYLFEIPDGTTKQAITGEIWKTRWGAWVPSGVWVEYYEEEDHFVIWIQLISEYNHRVIDFTLPFHFRSTVTAMV